MPSPKSINILRGGCSDQVLLALEVSLFSYQCWIWTMSLPSQCGKCDDGLDPALYPYTLQCCWRYVLGTFFMSLLQQNFLLLFFPMAMKMDTCMARLKLHTSFLAQLDRISETKHSEFTSSSGNR